MSGKDRNRENGRGALTKGEGEGAKTTAIPRGAFGYFGSKQRLAKEILQRLPPHHCWVELFGGSLALTMAKKPAEIEIVNDLDEEVVNAFRQMRENGGELARVIEQTPYARREFEGARMSHSEDSELERARKFLVRAMMSVNGVIGGKRGGFSMSDTYTRSGREARVNRWYKYPERLEAVAHRLREVRIENKDGIDLLTEYSNKPGTLVYIDPPYLGKGADGYNVDSSDQDFHERLISQALLCKCMIIISGYQSNTYTKLLEGKGKWHRITLKAATQTTNGDRLARQEVLWMNKAAKKAWETNRVGLRLTEKERKQGRINPPRGPIRRCRRIWRA